MGVTSETLGDGRRLFLKARGDSLLVAEREGRDLPHPLPPALSSQVRPPVREQSKVKFYPYEKGEGGNRTKPCCRGRGTTSFGVVFM